MSGEARESRRVRLTVEQVFSLMQGEAVVVDGDGDGERSLTIESDVEDARVAGE